jgi:four helix bundle protein
MRKLAMTSQMRRCAVSIASNLAEGSGRNSMKDKARFTEIAFGSALELLNQLILSFDFELLLGFATCFLLTAITS